MATSEQSEGRGGEGVDGRWGGEGGRVRGGGGERGESTGARRRREKEEEKGRDVATRA